MFFLLNIGKFRAIAKISQSTIQNKKLLTPHPSKLPLKSRIFAEFFSKGAGAAANAGPTH
jgi:hypothetical protein